MGNLFASSQSSCCASNKIYNKKPCCSSCAHGEDDHNRVTMNRNMVQPRIPSYFVQEQLNNNEYIRPLRMAKSPRVDLLSSNTPNFINDVGIINNRQNTLPSSFDPLYNNY